MATEIQTKRKQETQRAWLLSVLQQIQSREFYGKLTITLEKGFIRIVKKEEALKPPT